MAYSQIPGRGNNPKTGNGIPETFKQGEEGPKLKKAKEHYAKKEEGNEYTFQEVKKATEFAKGKQGTGLIPGTMMNPKTAQTIAKPYEKSLKSGKELGLQSSPNDLFITDSSGKIIKKAEARNTKAMEALKKEYSAGKTSTEDARAANVYSQNKRGVLGGGFSR